MNIIPLAVRKLSGKALTSLAALGLSLFAVSTALAQPSVSLIGPRGDVPRVTDNGYLIEPSLRMSWKGAPWDYEVRIALPPSYDPKSDDRYPVLWVTDGIAAFESAVTEAAYAHTFGVPELIVVAVGTPPEAAKQWSTQRLADFYPFRPFGDCSSFVQAKELYQPRCAERTRNGTQPPPGHAAEFLSFLANDVRGEIARRYRISDQDTLFGYSGGGGFCLFTLFTRPDAFEKYICGSPAIFSNAQGGGMLALEAQYAAAHSDLKADVVLSIGENEILEPALAGTSLMTDVTRIVEILSLRKYPSLKLNFNIYPDEIHEWHGVSTSLYRGLRTVWPTRMPTDIRQYMPDSTHGRTHPAQRPR